MLFVLQKRRRNKWKIERKKEKKLSKGLGFDMFLHFFQCKILPLLNFLMFYS